MILGLDIGSVAVGCVLVDNTGKVLETEYRFHEGKPRRVLEELLLQSNFRDARSIGVTATSPEIIRADLYPDPRTAYASGARRFFPDLSTLLVVGGERFERIHFDERGRYRGLKSNTSCAAGTGSFLDQQAVRLGLADSGELSDRALEARTAPNIASRCSVFAKTDLIHAQQEGYSLEAICYGLCRGLARNIYDVLFGGEPGEGPVVFAGGVSKNEAVRRTLEELIGRPVDSHPQGHLFGALGAALETKTALESTPENRMPANEESAAVPPVERIIPESKDREYSFEPLTLQNSEYPDFSGRVSRYCCEVEVEEYQRKADLQGPGKARPAEVPVFLGIDVGSTSTKAILTAGDEEQSGDPLFGFYTRTGGDPLDAIGRIFQAIRDTEASQELRFDVRSAGSTGSGRTFIGNIIGADLILDEITAHARAACSLKPETDTIIEIGGQDAKFTTLKDGNVTFSQMNSVCAAGTGSFLEEQAARVGIGITDFAQLAENVSAPLASDRCTVFMERDINHLVNRGYSVREVLAAAVHSVTENYLQKVADEAAVGSHIVFQGATAKNRALVAAFEQRLGRPITVSPYCHLTGALGAAILAAEEAAELRPEASGFRGFDLDLSAVSVRTETCDLCTNHCRITIASIGEEEVAYGFLCGRDYHTEHYVPRTEAGFDLVASRPRPKSRPRRVSEKQDGLLNASSPRRIGIPAALHLFEDEIFWSAFFESLGFEAVTDIPNEEDLKNGKSRAGAEFCAPMAAFHGISLRLARQTDVLFLPVYLEGRKNRRDQKAGAHRKYCYYSQFAPSLLAPIVEKEAGIRVLTPVISGFERTSRILRLLSGVLEPVLPGVHRKQVALAWRRAEWARQEARKKSCERFRKAEAERNPEEIAVVLVGRPYTILNPAMNKKIPELFAAEGVQTYYQDMLPAPGHERAGCLASGPDAGSSAAEGTKHETAGEGAAGDGDGQFPVRVFHWNYAAEILEAAGTTLNTPGLYPVLVTSFNCSPDSFLVEYFRRLADRAGKPYQILQLDEHDSTVGYGTRVESAVRAFRNHHRLQRLGSSFVKSGHLPVVPKIEKSLEGKTLLFPNWDTMAGPLLAANLRGYGIDARLLEEDETTIRRSMRLNTGQCIPMNVITQEFVDYVKRHGLDPAHTVLWMIETYWACGVGMYPGYIKGMFEKIGGGFENAGVYIGPLSHIDISPKLAVRTYLAFLFDGMLRRMSTRLRPYEREIGSVDRAVEQSRGDFVRCFEENGDFETVVDQVVSRFESIPVRREERPKVAVFGDVYVRDNDVINQDLIRFIEDHGGEVVSTPYNEYVKIIAGAYFKRWIKERQYLQFIKNRSLLAVLEAVEKRYLNYFREFTVDSQFFNNKQTEKELGSFRIHLEQEGESFDNALKIFYLLKQFPDISLFVQTNPAFCCPSMVTEAMSGTIEEITGVPVVTITYDGTGSSRNDLIVPYLEEAAKRLAPGAGELSRAGQPIRRCSMPPRY